jgi:cell shape-determining protein MreD
MRTFWQALAVVLFTLAAVNAVFAVVQPFHGTHATVKSVLAASVPALAFGSVALYLGVRRRWSCRRNETHRSV